MDNKNSRSGFDQRSSQNNRNRDLDECFNKYGTYKGTYSVNECILWKELTDWPDLSSVFKFLYSKN